MRDISVKTLDPRFELIKAELVGGTRPRLTLKDKKTHQKYIFKSYCHNSREVFAECLASFLGNILDISVQQVSIKRLPEQLAAALRKACPAIPVDWVPIGSLARNVFPKNGIIKYGASIINTPSQSMSLENIEQFFRKNYYAPDDLLKAFATMIVFDAIIGNMDRHHENWGIIESKKFRQFVLFNKKQYAHDLHQNRKFTPLFDHGSSLLFELTETAVCAYLKDLTLFKEHYVLGSKYSFIKDSQNKERNIFTIIEQHLREKTVWGVLFKDVITTKLVRNKTNPISLLEIAKKIVQMPNVPEIDYSLPRRDLLLRSIIIRIEKLISIISGKSGIL
jgi:hypothetical protein